MAVDEYEAVFLSIHHADMMNELTDLTNSLHKLADLLAASNECLDCPVWLQDAGSQPSRFLQNELMCRGSPQDFLRSLWKRHRERGNPASLIAALSVAVEALVGEPDPWALLDPPLLVYNFPVVQPGASQEWAFSIQEADYLSSGTGRFVYGAAQALSKRVLENARGADVRDKKVLELGCGIGLLGLACIAAGAHAVTMTDFEPALLAACEKNLKCNSEEFGGTLPAASVAQARCVQLDWTDVGASLPCLQQDKDDTFTPFDMLLGADLCYDLEHPVQLLEAIQALGRHGLLTEGAEISILNGWPNRGLTLFEHLIGAPEKSDGQSHERKFLNTDGESDILCGRHGQFQKCQDGFRFSEVCEVNDATDERGTVAQMRLYRFVWHGAAVAEAKDGERRIRARAISLRRCTERWDACESHMRQHLPDWLDFQMAEGLDGSLYKDLVLPMDASASAEIHVPQEEQVVSVEAALSCRLYRGWPVCETEDVLRVLAQSKPVEHENPVQSVLTESEAWDEYRKWFADWPRHRAWPYIDFHCRHITLGEIGAALSHVRLIDEAVRDGVELHLFFEDDARPRMGAVARLMEEIELLRKYNFEWDLIYLRASLYSKIAEEPLSDTVPGSHLFWARHRKVTDAYCLSYRGLHRIANSGFRDCLFAFDDFLPSLHSEHPRRDVMLLPSVIKARGDINGGFVGLSFGDEVLSDSARNGSETNLSPCVLGDHGAELC